jgi:hypothetical protein
MKPVRFIIWIWVILIGLLVLMGVLPLVGSPTLPGALLGCLPFGWWQFLRRNIPQMTWSWSLIATGLICSVFVLVLANTLLRALFYQFQKSRLPAQQVRRWPWHWTLCLYAGVWLLLAIAFGAAGVWRHSTWLMAYDKPWFQQRMSSYSGLRMADLLVRELILDNDEKLDATRKEFYSQTSYQRRQKLLADDFDVIFYGSNKVAAYVIVPRDPTPGSKAKFAISAPGTSEVFKPISELQHAVAELDATYPMTTIR